MLDPKGNKPVEKTSSLPPPHNDGLLKLGIKATILDVNQRIEEIAKGHQRLFGHNPDTGLVYDIVRGWGHGLIKDVPHMFDIPRSKQEALAKQVARQHRDALGAQLAEQARIGAITTAEMSKSMADIDPQHNRDTRPHNQPLYGQPGYDPSKGDVVSLGLASKVGSFGLAGKWTGQVLDSLVSFIPGLYYTAKAGTLDARDYSYKLEARLVGDKITYGTSNKKNFQGGRTAKLAKEMAIQVKEDVLHPEERGGYLFMDAWGVASLGIGFGDRLAAGVGRAAGYGESIAKASRTEKFLQGVEGVRNPGVHPGFDLGWGDYVEHFPAYENAALRLIQGAYLKKAQETLMKNQRSFDADGELIHDHDGRNRKGYDALFSPENLLHRARINRNTVEYAISMAPLTEMDRLTNFSARAKSALIHDRELSDEFGRLGQLQTPAMDKALLLIMTDTTDPISAWRSYHQRTIDDLNEQKKAYEAVTKEDAKALRARYEFHRQNAIDLKTQADELAAGQVQTVPREQLDNLQIHVGTRVPQAPFEQPVTPAIRELARDLLRAQNRGEPIPPLKVREGKDGLWMIDGEDAKDRLTAAKVAGIEDMPVRVVTVGEKEIKALRGQAKQQLGLAKKTKAPMQFAEKIMGKSKNQRREDLAELDYKITSHDFHLTLIDKATELLANPPKRFKAVVDRAYEISRTQEHLKEITYGFDPEIGHQHLAEVAAILRGERVRPILDEDGNPTSRLGRVVEGKRPDTELRGEVRAARKRVNAEERKLETIQIALAKPTKKGSVGDRPVLRTRLDETKARLEKAQADLAAAEEAASTQGSKVVPLEREILGEGETPATTPELATIAEMRHGRGSAYSGQFEREIDRGDKSSGRMKQRISKRHGVAPPKDQSTAWVRMSGEALEIGDFRWDVSQLLSEELKQVQRGAFAIVHHNDLWNSGVKEKISDYHMPIRDIQGVPAKLKKIARALDNHVIDPDMAKMIKDEDLEKLHAYLYPKEVDTKDPHLRWVDERTVFDRIGGQNVDFWRNVDDFFNKGFKPINEPWRLLLIFSSPAYILNAAGAAVTLAVEEGFASPHWLGRSWGSTKLWNDEVTRMLDHLAGSTHAVAITTEDVKNPFGRGLQEFYKGWQKITDRSFRRAAVIAELYKRGLISDSMSADEVLNVLKQGMSPTIAKLRRKQKGDVEVDPAVGRGVIEASQVGRKKMLDFDKMSWWERATLRHMIFVYSFLRAGSIWSFRFMGEHPVLWGVTAHAGQERAKEIKELIGDVPSWFYQGGYLPFDKNQAFNPVQLNMPAVLSQIAYSGQSLFNDAPYSDVSDMLSGVGILATDMLRGTTQAGQPLPGGAHGRIAGSFLDLLEKTPAGYAIQRSQKREKEAETKIPPPPVVVSETSPLEGAGRRERSFLKLSSFENDGFWNTYGRLIGRTADPVQTRGYALQARYWRDQRTSDPEAYMAHQLELAEQVAQRQAAVLGKTGVPPEVKDALELVAAREIYIQKWANAPGHHQQPGDRQQAALTIAFLKQEGRITDRQANQYRALLRDAHGKAAQRGVWLKALRENGGQAWADWVQDVNRVNYFNGDGYSTVVKNLKDSGIGDYAHTLGLAKEDKWAYGRKYVEYVDQRSDLLDKARAANTSFERRIIQEQLRQLDDSAADEVEVNGAQFPAMAAVKYGKLNPDQRAEFLRSRALAPWWSQPSFNRFLLTGQKTDPDVEGGYAQLAKWMQEAQAREDAKGPGRHLPSNTRSYYAGILAKTHPAFRDDLIYAGIIPKKDGTKTLIAERLVNSTPIQASSYRPQWEYLLGWAPAAFHAAITTGGWTLGKDNHPNYGGIADLWRTYYVPKVQSWLSQQAPGFQHEVETFVSEHPHFLNRLIKH